MVFGRKVGIVIYHGKKRVNLRMVNFMGFVAISSKMVKIRTDSEKGIGNGEYNQYVW